MKKQQFKQFIANRLSRLFCLLSVGTNMAVATATPAQELLQRPVTLRAENESVHDVLNRLEASAQVRFIYSPRLIGARQLVTIDVRNDPLSTVLTTLLTPLGVGYEVVGGQIVLKRSNARSDLLSISSLPIQLSAPLSQTIAGRVTDAATDSGLPGVNVVLKDTRNGTVTDTDGRFQLSVPDGRATLVFSFVGYVRQEMAVGNQTQLAVQLAPDAQALGEVVVTAFGIKREQKALGYAVQQVEGQQLTAVGNPNILNSLQGKAAGVSVRLSSGMPGRAPQVVIRGARSLTGSNQPLYVVDGLPVSGGDRAIDFNPADVESMDILKGPAASALYGLRASNGVIVITTKSGKSNQNKPTITFDTQVNQDQVSFLPDLQRNYAQGDNGVFNQNSLFTWGPRISTIGSYTNLLGQTEQAASYENDRAFYQKGYTVNNSLEVTQGGSIGTYAVGVARTTQTGIVPNSDLQRTNFKINTTLRPFQRLKIGLSANYSDLSVRDYPDENGNINFFRGLIDVPPSYNLRGKPAADPADPYNQIYYRPNQNNPYWVVDHNYRDNKTRRTFGSVFAEYRISDALRAVYRIGVDQYATRRVGFQDLGTAPTGRTTPPSGGFIETQVTNFNQINSNAYLAYDRQLTPNWNLNAVAGNETYDIRTLNDRVTGSNFVVGGWANVANATTIQGSTNETRQRVSGFYTNLNISYKDLLFLTVSGRNDIVSNMPARSRSFFYPSVSGSFILSEAIPSLQKVVNVVKLRASWAEVGQAGQLFVNGAGYVQRNPGFVFPFNGVTTFAPSPVSISPDIKPENTRSIEAGLDVRLLNGRIGIDYTYFNSLSRGQILGVPLPTSTGADREIRNSGLLSSYGHELTLRLVPLKAPRSRWDITLNFSSIRTMVEDLPEGLARITLAEANGGQAYTVAQKGYAYPSLYGRTYFRDPASGQIVVNSVANQPTTGMPLLSGSASVLGSPNPDFEINFINSVQFRRLTLGFQIDWRQGGVFFPLTYAEARWRGLAAETLDRETQVVIPGKKGRVVNGQVVVEGDNDLTTFRNNTFFSASSLFNNVEAQLQDASFVRFRELNVSYDLPTVWLKRVLGLSQVSVYLTGRNLFLITKAFVDPEMNMTNLGGSSVENSYGIEIFQQPQTKSFGAGLRLKW